MYKTGGGQLCYLCIYIGPCGMTFLLRSRDFNGGPTLKLLMLLTLLTLLTSVLSEKRGLIGVG
jgi:hypothetical protein